MPHFRILFYANYTILANQRGAMAPWPPPNTPLIISRMNLQGKKHEFIYIMHPLIHMATAWLKICRIVE